MQEQSLYDTSQQLEQGIVDAEQYRRMATLGMMCASIAHELNNILTPILSYSQLAQANPDDRALITKSLSRTHEGACRAAAIVRSILGLVDSTMPIPETTLAAGVSQAVERTIQDQSCDNITFDISINPELRVAISSVALQQVVTNLVMNSMAAIGPKQGKIEIQGAELTDNNGVTWVSLTIKDTGRGIPGVCRARLFEPLNTAQHADSKRHGSGLGLAICKQLLRDAGGAVELVDTSIHGTTFRILLRRV